MEPYEVIRFKGTEEEVSAAWRAERRKGIGGSDVAAIMGLSRYRSPYEVWAEKVGAYDPPDMSGVQAVEWGNRLEPVVKAKYAEEHPDRRARRLNGMLRSRARPWAQASLDYEVRDPDLGWGVLEVKTVGLRRAQDWEGGVPVYYQTQVAHYLSVTGRPFADVAVLVGGQEYRDYRIARDEEDVAAVEAAVDSFWRDRVLAGDPPQAGAGDGPAVFAAHPSGDAYLVMADAECPELARWLEARKAADAAWRAEYLAPSVSGLSASRCNASGEADADGASMLVSCSWAARQPGNRVTQVKVEYRPTSASSWTQAYGANPNAALGTLDAVCGGSLDPDAVYDVRVTVSDAGGSSTALTRLPGRSVAVHFGRKGAGAAFFKRVDRDGLDVGGLAWLEGGQTVAPCTGTNGAAGYLHVCTVRIGQQWCGTALSVAFVRRTDNVPTLVTARFGHEASDDPPLVGLCWAGGCGDVWLSRSAAGTWEMYVEKYTASDSLNVLGLWVPTHDGSYEVDWRSDQAASLPAGATRAVPARQTGATMTLSQAYGVQASRGPDGTVAVCSRGASALPAGGQWTQVALGTLPEGWRPPFDAMQAVPCGGGTVYLGVTASGEVSYTRATPTQSADGVYATLCYPAYG